MSRGMAGGETGDFAAGRIRPLPWGLRPPAGEPAHTSSSKPRSTSDAGRPRMPQLVLHVPDLLVVLGQPERRELCLVHRFDEGGDLLGRSRAADFDLHDGHAGIGSVVVDIR